MRMDRTILTCKEFVRNTAEMGPPFVEPVTDTIEMIFDEMVSHALHRTWANTGGGSVQLGRMRKEDKGVC